MVAVCYQDIIRMCGASCILYEGVLEGFAKEKKADIIILPSSIHEVLLIIDRDDLDYVELQNMVKEINKAELPDEDVLSDRVYRYSLGDGKISIIRQDSKRKEL